jgi:hypothetical protein
MAKQWEEMTPQEKQEANLQKIMTIKDPEGNDVPFQSKEAETNYQACLTRFKDALHMNKTPDRVPAWVLPGFFPILNAGITMKDAMYDYDKCVSAVRDYVLEFKPDMHMGAAGPGPGKFYEMLDYKLYAWPGHGVSDNVGYQCLEGEYMKPEEYGFLIADPSFYFNHFYLPRVFGALQGFTMLPPSTGILEMYGVAFNFVPYALPPVQETFKTLFEAGGEALKWAIAVGGLNIELGTMGFPNIFGGFTKAPFDIIGDTLRGTRGIMTDMYRQPDMLLKAMEALVPTAIGMGIGAAQATGNPFIFIPLHKGADGFLSDEQFKKFYWPTFQAVIGGLVANGLIPFPALEGYWDTRMDVIKDVPKGTTAWMVDNSDIFKAKKTLGKNACLIGNVSSSMLRLAKPDEVKDYGKKLIDQVGKDGGFILCNGAFFDEANPENVRAMIETAKEHGKY